MKAMTPSTAELARALVASPRWEWRVAMAAEDGDRVYEGRDVDPVRGWRRDGSILPDLDDPATAGVLLAMLDESHEIASIRDVRRDTREVAVVLRSGVYTGPTLGVAVARALLAVRGGS